MLSGAGGPTDGLFAGMSGSPTLRRLRHSHTYYVDMKRVTLSLDEATLRDARRIAAEQSTSVNALIRRFLEQLAARESRAHAARQRIVKVSRGGGRGSSTWTRDDLHAR